MKAGLRLMPTSVHVAFNFVAHARTTHPTPSALMALSPLPDETITLEGRPRAELASSVRVPTTCSDV